jgi:hypothetical protein
VAVGALWLTGIFFGFPDYGSRFVGSPPFINDAPLERLAVFRPANELHADAYGWMLDLQLMTYGLAIAKILRWGRRVNANVGRAAIASALIAPALALLFWEGPYRLVYQSRFDRVDLGSTRCYRMGDDGVSLFLHCPDVAPPRNRIVPRNHAQLRERGVRESIFAPPGTLQTLD